MSFKEKIIAYCNETKYDCDNCPLRTPCFTTSKNIAPKWFTEEQIERLQKETFAEYRMTCKKLAKIIDFLFCGKEEEKHEPNNL